MFREKNELQQLCYDVYYNKVTKYSNGEANDVIRQAFLDELDPLPAKKSGLKRWAKNNSSKFFELLEDTVNPIVNRLSVDALGSLVKTNTIDDGDEIVHIVKNKNLFPVAQIATGVGATHRRRMHNGKMPTEEFRLSAFIYEEAFEMLYGDLNWTELVDRVAESFVHKIATLTSACIFDAYDEDNNAFFVEVNKAGLETALDDLLDKVEGATGVKCKIVGAKGALRKIPNSGGVYFEKDNADRRELGYVGVYGGNNQLVELAQYYDKDAAKFEVSTNMLLVVPDNEALAHLTYVGDAEIVNDTDMYNRKDRQIEMEMQRTVALSVAIASTFGMIKITD